MKLLVMGVIFLRFVKFERYDREESCKKKTEKVDRNPPIIAQKLDLLTPLSGTSLKDLLR